MSLLESFTPFEINLVHLPVVAVRCRYSVVQSGVENSLTALEWCPDREEREYGERWQTQQLDQRTPMSAQVSGYYSRRH